MPYTHGGELYQPQLRSWFTHRKLKHTCKTKGNLSQLVEHQPQKHLCSNHLQLGRKKNIQGFVGRCDLLNSPPNRKTHLLCFLHLQTSKFCGLLSLRSDQPTEDFTPMVFTAYLDGCPGTEVRIKGSDQWVFSSQCIPFISRFYNNPPILTF